MKDVRKRLTATLGLGAGLYLYTHNDTESFFYHTAHLFFFQYFEIFALFQGNESHSF